MSNRRKFTSVSPNYDCPKDYHNFHNIMISLFFKNYKPISQTSYNNLISSLRIHNLTCTCGMSGHMIKHAYYKRLVKHFCVETLLKILRVKCKHCGKTHALLPSQLIPYSQIPLDDTVAIINAWQGLEKNKYALKSYEEIMASNHLIDFSNVKYIIKQFKDYWHERLKTYDLDLDSELVINCFKYFGRQFMQVKRNPNILFFLNHIT